MVPAHQGLGDGGVGPAQQDDPGVGAGQGGGVGPQSQGLAGGAQLRAGRQGGAVEQEDGAVAALGDGLGAGGGHDEPGAGVDRGDDAVVLPGPGDDDGHTGEGAAELLAGARRADPRHAQGGPPAGGAGPRRGGAGAPAAARGAVAPPVQGPAAGGAAGAGAAGPAGQAQDVAAAGHLDQGGAPLQGAAQGPVGQGGDAGAAAGALGVELGGAGGFDARHGAAHEVARRAQVGGPAPLDVALRLHAAGVAGDEQAGALQAGAQRQDGAGVDVGGAGLVEAVVAVVPDGGQAQAGHGGEGGGARAHRQAGAAQQEAQEGAVAPGGAVLGGQDLDRLALQLALQAPGQGLGPGGGGHDDEPAAPAGQGRPQGPGQEGLPGGDQAGAPGQGGPHGPRAVAGGEFAQQLGAAQVGPPAGGVDVGRAPDGQRRGGGVALGALGGGVPGGHGQAHHVGARAGGAGGHGPDQAHGGGGEDRQVGDHAAQGRQAPGVGGGGAALPDPAAHVLAAEAHGDAGADPGGGVQAGRDEVVEEPVQVRHGGVEQDAGHRVRHAVGVHAALGGGGHGEQGVLPGRLAHTPSPARRRAVTRRPAAPGRGRWPPS